MAADALSRRALNRATLDRQRLLSRAGDVHGTIEHLVGMQAQNPLDPYYALWARIERFEPDELGRMLVHRDVVRAQLMRGTIHLVTARDYARLRPAFASVLERVFRSTAFAKDTAGFEGELLRVAEELLDGQPMSRAELGRDLEKRWPGLAGSSMAQAATFLLPVVQTTPRGVWGTTGAAKWATARSWLGEASVEPEPPDAILHRYLAAFGPASVSDARTWSGLTGLREVAEHARPRLRVWRSEDGRELLDLPDATHPDPDTPAPPRFLPEYDNVLLGHADRSRFFDAAVPQGWVGNLLVDGFLAGSWRLDRRRRENRLIVIPLTKLSAGQHSEVEAEADRLISLVSAGGTRATVEFAMA